MTSNHSKIFAEYLVVKLTQAGWQLTYGNWEENFLQNIGQELVWEDETRLIIISCPNTYFSNENSNNHISLLLNDKAQKKYVEFGYDFVSKIELDKSLETIINFQNNLTLANMTILISELLNLNVRLCWESQGQILEEMNRTNLNTEKFIVHQ